MKQSVYKMNAVINYITKFWKSRSKFNLLWKHSIKGTNKLTNTKLRQQILILQSTPSMPPLPQLNDASFRYEC